MCQKTCVVCGGLYSGWPSSRYCGDTCRRARGYDEAAFTQRRRANNDRKYERQRAHRGTTQPTRTPLLTWRALWKEAGGNCYLCGKPCDPNDHYEKNGGWVTGWRYPTLDHVVPIRMGGRHERENARLAHKWCNTIKGDRPLKCVETREDYQAAFQHMPNARVI